MLARLDGRRPASAGRTLEVLPDGLVERRRWSPHPSCGCTGLRAVTAAPGRERADATGAAETPDVREAAARTARRPAADGRAAAGADREQPSDPGERRVPGRAGMQAVGA
ncbi:hypothetical protein GCM10025868_37520 [Angustibacter aerolatus]|uniref:Uncharacterized protein n=1 Tax=Angustibacter aerolatus TaxID=1162965 RepID=A0ABQ6JNV1_9ACTN|nr:hypothetical protein [Angustibacter aerolatus]GMA88502.1 hypothetical protein GCM10025868_37520 [Angustibacter aerolatus]